MGVLMQRLAELLDRRSRVASSLELRIRCFREVLHANNQALGHIAAIQQALAGEREVSAAEARRQITGVTLQTYRMISNLNLMTANRFRRLAPRFEELKAAIVRRAEVTPYLGAVGTVVPLAEIGATHAEVVGQKSAYLGQARRILGGAVPAGFATTTAAYEAFVGQGEVRKRIDDLLDGLDPHDIAACFEASARIAQIVEATAVPPDLAAALDAAAAAVVAVAPSDREPRFAVRSSALQEGGRELSFAGQYRSLLNVRAASMCDAFRQVVASKYSPEAISYRAARGFDDREVGMCCCVVLMIDAAAAGVVYSACPAEEGARTLLQAVRGLGLAAVDGSAEPDSVVVDRAARRVVARKRGRQGMILQAAVETEGTERHRIAEPEAGAAALDDATALAVCELAWRLEDALGTPVDMEWAVDRKGRPWVLQVRPQPAHADLSAARREPVAGAPVLLAGGSRASGGAAVGRVCRVSSDLDLLRCPQGAVVVAAEASPRLAVLLPRAAALVADMGEVTGHLATVARELRVPALLATRTAMATLEDGAEVTVDADAAVVYSGRVEQALAAAAPAPLARNPNRELLASVAELIVPLTLRDRLASVTSARRCNTLHDLIRFCHQATVEAMFELGDRSVRSGAEVRRLVSPVPIDCRVIDLGGGVAAAAEGEEITVEDLTSVPMRALWRGMSDARLGWRKTRPVSLQGFMSALVNYNFDQDARVRSMGEPSFAFVSATYLNLNSRVGYHFSTVDANLTDIVESNYVSFRFVGGATGVDQRSRRAALIERVLARFGFETDRRADLVNARLRHRPAAPLEEALTLLGLLTGFVNHLDMAMVNDALVEQYARAFLAGDVGYRGEGDG